MTKVTATAKFPTALVTQPDIGVFTNFEGVSLTSDATNVATLFNTTDPANIPVDAWVLIDGPNGWEIMQVDAIDAGADTVTLDRAKDGTVAVAHLENHRLQAVVPAIALNQMRVEIIAIETHLGKDGDCQTWDRAIKLSPTHDTCPILTLDLKTATTNTKFISFESDGTETGFIKYDSGNDAIEFQGIRIDVGANADLNLEDDRRLLLGTDLDATLLYDSADDRVELRGDKVIRFEKADATERATFATDGSLNINPTGTPGFQIAGTTVFEADRDFAIDFLPNADNTLDLGSGTRNWAQLYLSTTVGSVLFAGTNGLVSEDNTNLFWDDGANELQAANIDVDTGVFKVGGTTVFENDRDLAIDLIPNADGTLDIGSPTRRFAQGHFDLVRFAEDQAAPAHTEGVLFYDATDNDKSLSFYVDESEVTLNVGQENWVRVRNSTGVTITNGSVVYINGVHGGTGLPTVALADASDLSKSNAIGVATHDIETSSFGYVTTFGKVRGLDTSSFTAGDEIYLSASTPGALTQTIPSHPDYLMRVGTVSKSNVSTGSIIVNTRGPEEGRFAPGSVLFAEATGETHEDNTNFFYDDAANELQIANLDVTTGTFKVGGTTVFENDRDLAVDLIPNADNSLDLGSLTRAWNSAYTYQLTIMNSLAGGNPVFSSANAGSATLDVAAFLVPSSDQGFSLGSSSRRWSSISGVNLRTYASAGDAQSSAILNSSGLQLGPGGSTAPDVVLSRSSANLLELASGDSFNIASGALQFGGTTLFESDRDLAVDLLPNADDGLDLGSSTRRFVNLHLSGGMQVGIRSISSTPTTLAIEDYFASVDSSGGIRTTNLPASPLTGEIHTVKRNGSSTVTVDGNGNNIDGSATFTLTDDDEWVTVIYNGTQWEVIG